MSLIEKPSLAHLAHRDFDILYQNPTDKIDLLIFNTIRYLAHSLAQLAHRLQSFVHALPRWLVRLRNCPFYRVATEVASRCATIVARLFYF
jgi:hypothetical protein